MREIKFRGWDYELNKMYKHEDFIQKKSNYLELAIHETSLTLMQYTGLKDKNGVEIYEGDVVKVYIPAVSCNLQDRVFNKLVSFENGSFTLEWIDKYKKGFWSSFIGLSNECDIEVIGNIYENKELLEVSK